MNQMSSEAVLKIQGSEGNIVYFRHDLGPVQNRKLSSQSKYMVAM